MISMPYGLAHDDENPMYLIEELAETKEWKIDRASDDTLYIRMKSGNSDYIVHVEWQDEFQTLQFACMMEIDIPEAHLSAASQLLMEINDNVWLGHFTLPSRSNRPTFRYAAMLVQGMGENQTYDLIADIMSIMQAECDRFVQAFAMLASGDVRTREVLSAAILETHGEA